MHKISLMYHDMFQHSPTESGFQNAAAHSFKLTELLFEEHVSAVADWCRAQNVPFSQVAFTFDDGGVSAHSIVAPILERHGFRGFFFVTTAYIGNVGFLDRSQILDLHDRGHVIGSHSHTHPAQMSALPEPSIRSEWATSIQVLKQILNLADISCASIPGGFFCTRSRDALVANGVKLIFTSTPTARQAPLGGGVFVIGRYAIKHRTSAAEVRSLLSPFSPYRLRACLRWHALQATKLLLGSQYQRMRRRLYSGLSRRN